MRRGGAGTRAARAGPAPQSNFGGVDVVVVLVAAVGHGGVAEMQVDAVGEPELVLGLQNVVAADAQLGLEVGHAEGIGGHEAVISDVPVRWVVEVAGGVEDGDADELAVDGAGVVAPHGSAPPGLGLADGAVGVLDAAAAAAVHGGGDAHRADAAFLGVAEGDLAGSGLEGDAEVDDALVGRQGVDADLALLGEGALAAGRDPVELLADDGEDGAVDGFLDALADLAAVVPLLGPVVDAVDVAVGHPDAAVVAVVAGLVGQALDHGVVAGDLDLVGAEDGVEVRAGTVLVEVVGGEGEAAHAELDGLVLADHGGAGDGESAAVAGFEHVGPFLARGNVVEEPMQLAAMDLAGHALFGGLVDEAGGLVSPDGDAHGHVVAPAGSRFNDDSFLGHRSQSPPKGRLTCPGARRAPSRLRRRSGGTRANESR